MEYVSKVSLEQRYDFKKTFVEYAETLFAENRVPEKRQELINTGKQTAGNLFEIETELTKNIEQILRTEISRYRKRFQDHNEGFITQWPNEYKLFGWLVSLKTGGELKAHMHEKGWISGSAYLRVPDKTTADAGNLVVCIEKDHFLKEGTSNQKKTIDVSTGDLCLFPSSLLHYTIPFASKEERLVLAFDMVPSR